MTGMVLLESPKVASTRVTVFTAMIYAGGKLEEIQGSLHYFKDEHDEKEYPAGLYHLDFTAAKRDSSVEVYTDDPEEEAKFVFVGDIKKICIPQVTPEGDDTWTIDPCQQVAVHVTCTVTTDDQQAATFTATPEQYTSAFQDAKCTTDAVGTVFSHKPVFPVYAYISESPRFKNAKKPTPFSKRYCGFTGYLTGIYSTLEGEKMVDRFCAAVDTVSFLGAVVGAAPKAVSKAPAASSSKAGSSGKRHPVIPQLITSCSSLDLHPQVCQWWQTETR
ncbi:hypothetical protein C8J57DRAFT_1383072 [Mycena rebaudengoi]|nr:hypothetical protein C8J57DRAFT_1383072 [Mycena rebaudengoi]